MPSPVANMASALDQFTDILRTQGVAASLRYLNQRVEHRCTAIYGLEAMTVRNLYLYDREGALIPEALGVVPLGDSFCQHALRDGPFGTDDSAADARLAGSPFQGVVVAYHAVPLSRGTADLIGTLCHFDFVPRSMSDAEFAFLQKAARMLPTYL
ncbi:MAG TPA: GAF domain-containing protein [Burkholderiaceae bacterium]